MATEMIDARLKASVNALAAARRSAPPSTPVWLTALRRAADRLLDLRGLAEAGSSRPPRSMLARYGELTMLPNTAMPSAPPSSRVVSLTAEPTPALASGTALMMLARRRRRD